MAPFLLWQTTLQLDFHFDELSPVDQIDQIDAPLLIIAGEKDERTTLNNTNLLYSSAEYPKMLWVIPNAAHQDFLLFSTNEYTQRILSFLKKYLN
ncbi:MAG: prolyl oligopeptidase family serine peptidase [Hyphomicrobiales bacterium]|nr:prolyl oligopeptidase family serine peptidase [Hyphomicrobiales bacterium]